MHFVCPTIIADNEPRIWFAWRPIQRNGLCVWGEFVLREKGSYGSDYYGGGGTFWHYHDMPSDPAERRRLWRRVFTRVRFNTVMQAGLIAAICVEIALLTHHHGQ